MQPSLPQPTAADVLVTQGIAALHAGNQAQARALLTSALHLDPKNQQAWLWLSGVVGSDGERRYCLEQVLTINPYQANALHGLKTIPSQIQAALPRDLGITIATTRNHDDSFNVLQPQPGQAPIAASPLVAAVPQRTEPPLAVPQPAPDTHSAGRPAPTPIRPQLEVSTVRIDWATWLLVSIGSLIVFVIAAILHAPGLVVLLVLGTSLWVGFDARAIGVGRIAHLKGMGAFGWFMICLLFWIGAFPCYVALRDSFKRADHRSSAPALQNNALFWIGIGGVPLLLSMCVGILTVLGSEPRQDAGQQPAASTGHREEAATEQSSDTRNTLDRDLTAAQIPDPTPTPHVVEPPFKITELKTTWTTTSRGLTVLDGLLWVPELQLTVRNTSAIDIDALYFRVVFIDAKGVISGDDVIEIVRNIPAGHAKGPAFMHGSVGYKSDMAFLPMMEDSTQQWQYELFVGEDYSGPWQKIEAGRVDLPPEYQLPDKPNDKPVY